MNTSIFKNIKSDLPASIVVFFVALPLCLGIALASGAPLFSGIIAGIVGGVIVGAASGSKFGVSGPAAGLAVIVLTAIETLGSWNVFLAAVVIAGALQILMGYAKAGVIAHFFPSSVIKGMLTGIGLMIIIKQIPHALGYDKDPEGDFSFIQANGENALNAISSAISSITPGALIIGFISLAILILWDKVLSKKHKVFQLIQGPIVAIGFGILMNYLYQKGFLNYTLAADQIVSLPVAADFSGFLAQFTHPSWDAFVRFDVWKVAIVMAIVASLETLLCVEATDKLDPNKNVTPTNRELKAQGLGNIVSGLIGGLPLTQVIVRSSANISFGAKSKLSGILHGFFLFISVLLVSSFLNMIPLASLAAILLVVGYKLAKPALFKSMYHLGHEQFVPFCATVVGILFTDLLVGLGIGMAFGIIYTLYASYKNSHQYTVQVSEQEGVHTYIVTLAEEVTFLNKVGILKTLNSIPSGSRLKIDYSKNKSKAYDVVEVIEDFIINAKTKNISVENQNILTTLKEVA